MGVLADLVALTPSDGIATLVVVAVVTVIAIGIRPVFRLLSLRARLKVIKQALDRSGTDISDVSNFIRAISRLEPADRIRLDIEIDHESSAAPDSELTSSESPGLRKGLLRFLTSVIRKSWGKKRSDKTKSIAGRWSG